MRKMIARTAALAFAASFLLSAPALSASIGRKALNLAVGGSATLTVKDAPKGKKTTWLSSNKAVAAVDADGKVTGKKAGKATITAKVNGKKSSCVVTVRKLSMSAASATVYKGSTKTLSVKGAPKTASTKWASKNPKIASVGKDGKVKGLKAGTTTVTAKCCGKTFSCKVTVKSRKVKKGTEYMEPGQTGAFLPKEVTDWKSSNEKVAALSGVKVKAKKPGKAVIKGAKGGLAYEWTVIVLNVNAGATVGSTASAKPAVKFSSVSESEVTRKLWAMRSKYPQGMPWGPNVIRRSDVIVDGKPCDGYGCVAFVFALSDAAFGKERPGQTTYRGQKTKSLFMQVRPGDIVAIGDDENNNHKVIVLEKNRNGVVIAEGNWNFAVNWGRFLSASQVDEASYVISRY